MKILSIGAGPAGLYFSLLMKKAQPASEITVVERNGSDDTFGFGVVFSDETLGNFEEADADSYHSIRAEFAYWTDIDTYYRGEKITAGGNGFCGIPRVKLLEILHARCRALGVKLEFKKEFADFGSFPNYDLVLAADGINSAVRARFAERFRPTIHWGRPSSVGSARRCRSARSRSSSARTSDGLFQIHAYPFQADRSTFIVECPESTWRKAGLDKASEADTVAYFERLFADHLQGHRLLTNRSIWRSFPTVRNESWHHGNVVLVGDAAHTAHFSIGSGTKLAMEDAIALVSAFRKLGFADVPRVLAAYEDDAQARDAAPPEGRADEPRVVRELATDTWDMDPLPFTMSLMSRSKQVTYDNLGKRDPALVARIAEGFARQVGMPPAADGSIPPPMFAPLRAAWARARESRRGLADVPVLGGRRRPQ